MSRRALSVAVLAAALLALPAAATARTTPRYYLSLGDSLSRGQQPDVNGVTRNTDQGYPNQLFAIERGHVRGLQLVQLGCGGETTGSVINGKGNKYKSFFHCFYKGGSQLTAAVRFLRAHHRRNEVPLVTIDIGANDIDGCVDPGVNLGTCVAAGTAAIKNDTPKILSALRRAAPAGTRLVAMNLYDPVLGGYFSTNASTRGVALASPGILKSINADIGTADSQNGFRTADIGSAFSSYDSTTMVTWMNQSIPLNVSRICAWTWACATPPSGPNIHANKNGYAVIAATFAKVIGKLR